MRSLLWLDPRALWWLAASVPVIALYVLRTRRVRVRVPSVLHWSAAQREALARTPWKRLRAETSLLLQLLVILAVALAAARPALRSSAREEHVALILDVSASMGAREGASTRLALAQRAAHAAADALLDRAEVTVLAAGADVDVLAASSTSREEVHRAIDRASVSEVEGGLAEALSLAEDRLRAQGGERRAVVFTDRAVARDEARPGDLSVEVRPVGTAQDNVALARMELRTAREGASEVVQAFALVANLGAAPARRTVRVRPLDGAEAWSERAVDLAPGQREPVSLRFPLRSSDIGRAVAIELLPRDALEADDVAYGRVPPGSSLRVAVVGREPSPWIERALAADPQVELLRASPEQVETLPLDALWITTGLCLQGRDPEAWLAFAPPTGACRSLRVDAAVEAPRITSFTGQDPRLRFLTWEGVHLVRATPLSLGADDTDLVRSERGALVADLRREGRSTTVVGFDPSESDWPLHASWVVFLRNVAEAARAQRAHAIAGVARTGAPLRFAVPSGAQGLTASLAGRSIAVQRVGSSATLARTDRAGLYELRWNGGSASRAVNLLSERESDLRAAPWSPQPATTDASSRRGAPSPREVWGPWLAALAALAALGDLLWWSRRAPRAPEAA